MYSTREDYIAAILGDIAEMCREKLPNASKKAVDKCIEKDIKPDLRKRVTQEVWSNTLADDAEQQNVFARFYVETAEDALDSLI